MTSEGKALLVIDVQRGAFDGLRCPPIAHAESLVANTLALLAAARATATPVVFVQHLGLPGDAFAAGEPGGALHESLAPRRGEPVVQKRHSSGFEETKLAATLDAVRARELLVCGLQSEQCVFNTSAAALEAGYRVVLASDGHATWPTPSEPASAVSARINRALRERGARLATTAELVARLQCQGCP